MKDTELKVKIELTKREADIVLLQLKRKIRNNQYGLPMNFTEDAYNKIKLAIEQAQFSPESV
jgi:hypothetical protein